MASHSVMREANVYFQLSDESKSRYSFSLGVQVGVLLSREKVSVKVMYESDLC